MSDNNSNATGKIVCVTYIVFCVIIGILSLGNSYWIMAISIVSIPTILSGGLLMSFSSVLFVLMGWSKDSTIGTYLFYFDFVVHICINLLILNYLGYLIQKLYLKYFPTRK
jgi:hypothetical protein